MKIMKAFKYRLKPTALQRQWFINFAGMTRYVYNYGLGCIKKAFDQKIPLPTFKDLAYDLPPMKKSPDTCWLKEAHSQILQQALKDLEQAIKHFFRRLKKKNGNPGFPKFKKKGIRDTFRYPQGVKVQDSRCYLPKIGWVRYYDSRPLEGEIKQVTIKKEGEHWFVVIICQLMADIKPVIPVEAKVVGIDLGLKIFAYLSDGSSIENPAFLKKALVKLRILQRRHSRTQKGSKNRSKLRQKLIRLHTFIKNKRSDYLHKVTTELVKNHDALVVEDLNVSGMIKNRKLSRAIADAGWHTFVSYLRYKAAWLGKSVISINRFLPTSKECSRCHKLQDMPLKVRTYSCSSCGLSLDRDLNASINIRAAGLVVLKACGGKGVGLPDEARIAGF